MRHGDQRGMLMVGLMAMIAVMIILSAVAVQAWEDVKRRDDEAEMIFRAQEIVRAIKKYQKDQGQLPTEMDQLIKPGNKRQYFLRKLYKDPLVKGGKWGLLYMAPGGGILDPSVQGADQPQPLGLTQKSLPKMQGIGGGVPGAPADLKGLPIAGVKSLCKEKTFRVYRGQTEYSQWNFTIFDLESAAPSVPGMGGGKGQQGNRPGMQGRPGGGGPGPGPGPNPRGN